MTSRVLYDALGNALVADAFYWARVAGQPRHGIPATVEIVRAPWRIENNPHAEHEFSICGSDEPIGVVEILSGPLAPPTGGA